MIRVVNKITPKMKSRFGSVHISLTEEVLKEIIAGKKVVADIFDEYTVIISVGDKTDTEEEV